MDKLRTDARGAALRWAILIGFLLGSLSRYSSSSSVPIRWLGNFGAIWLLVAYLVGRSRTLPHSGAIAGAVVLVAAPIAHYVPYRIARFGFDLEVFRWYMGMWPAIGVVAGALFGYLGSRRDALGVAITSAALAGESMLLWFLAPPEARLVAVPVQLVLSLSLPLLLDRAPRLRACVLTLLLLAPAIAVLWVMIVKIGRVYPGL